MRFPYVTCVILLAGCATASAPIPFSQDFTLEVRDAPEARRFDLVLVAGASSICFGIEQWPDRNGRVDTGSIARVVTDAGTFEAQSYNFGYCPACELRVPAHRRLSSSVSYDEFPEAARLRSAPSPERSTISLRRKLDAASGRTRISSASIATSRFMPNP